MTRRNIAEVHRLRQSLWLDNLRRRLIRTGNLAWLRDLGVTGTTSTTRRSKQGRAGHASPRLGPGPSAAYGRAPR